MLFNPKWDLYSLAGLRDWLAKQPADEAYNWSSSKTCVVGKYLMAHGELSIMYSLWCDRTPRSHLAVVECFADGKTMGEALTRLDAWLAMGFTGFETVGVSA